MFRFNLVHGEHNSQVTEECSNDYFCTCAYVGDFPNWCSGMGIVFGLIDNLTDHHASHPGSLRKGATILYPAKSRSDVISQYKCALVELQPNPMHSYALVHELSKLWQQFAQSVLRTPG